MHSRDHHLLCLNNPRGSNLHLRARIAILEALSCETSVVATPVGGNPEVIRNFENGILVPVNNPLKIAEAEDYLAENKNARIEFGKTGRKCVIEDFSNDIPAKRLCKIYESILNS